MPRVSVMDAKKVSRQQLKMLRFTAERAEHAENCCRFSFSAVSAASALNVNFQKTMIDLRLLPSQDRR